MVRIKITKSGLYNQKNELVPVGKVLELSKVPAGWVNKYVVLDDDSKLDLHVNDDSDLDPPADETETDETETDKDELTDEQIIGKYKEVFGKDPHPSMLVENMLKKINEAVANGSDDNS